VNTELLYVIIVLLSQQWKY